MITVTEATSLAGSQAHFKALKPWWDVIMDYFLILMVMISFFSATLVILMDKVVCMPVSMKPNKSTSNVFVTASETSLSPSRDIGHLTNLDFQQYIYVSAVCYHKVVPWQSKYFPYMALINTLLLLVSSNFWFKYPKTSSKVEHFLSILAKCFDSPWTTKALEETTDQPSPEHIRLKSSSTRSMEYSPRTPLLKEAPFSPIQVPVSTILDRKEEEQAKALFEKIRHFRSHAEDSDIVYRVYLGQTIFKVVKVTIVLIYAFSLVGSFHFQHICKPGIQKLMGYTAFHCTHNLAYILKKLLLTYIIFVCLYSLLAVYSLFWLLSRQLKIYSFEEKHDRNFLGDIPDVKKDFAFLLHMLDCYDSLYSRRFSVFLSAVSEERLREMALNSEWSVEKLRQQMNKNAKGRWELQLSMLPAIPKATYDLMEVEVLKLDLISSAKLSGMVSKLRSLSEIHLCHCSAKVDPDAHSFLQDHLKILHIRFTDLEELPRWIYCMKSLEQLHLSGNLNSTNNKTIRLHSFQGMTELHALFLTSNLSHIPSAIIDVGGQLSKLSLQNGDTELGSLSQLKKMRNLLDLQLQHCKITKIPEIVSSLTKLRSLNLAFNELTSVNQLGSLQRLKSLCILRLSNNYITHLPPSIELLCNLEELYLSHNKLEALPVSLFSLVKLKQFDISYNSIRSIPTEIGHLTRLEHIALTGNQITSLPREMFRCTRLKSLHAANNKISRLPHEIGQLTHLSSLELTDNKLTFLPEEIVSCILLRKGGLDAEKELINSLPSDIKSKFS
ncbi:LOW QUALITY PROTEIN: volume-regulated anion channel subunit LRRC8D-like [Bombina bombina]|uniref:LOW QUALITY PROTEIN: volume-regulated anion channel subunit LRRC8D-like n=1 Tax=Bombina bombina TaxID=8345 RepID=UPI00235ADBCF|nr:LOW QUALITY PROTEIN: volume-regulated anion channel subunit LRRC8D-like [Bombina bombina]